MGRCSLGLATLLVISVLWKPALSDNKCAVQCKGTPSGATFLSGHKYTYGVEGTVSVYLTGADKQQTSVKLLGQAAVTSLGNCGYELKVQNLVISGPDGKKHGSPPGIDKPVHFSLQDGRLGAEICTEDGDTRRSLNIKRAIISLLQTENKPSTQIDVFGACPTEASSSQEGAALLVHRTRDLSRCAHRESGRHDLLNGIFNPAAEIKNTQVLQSTLHIESKVNAGIPEKVSATEEYLYKPFSVGENGARAKVHTKLTLTGKAAGAAGAATCTVPRSVIFEIPHGVTSAGHHDAALAAVKDTAKTLGSEASSKSAGEFAQLVRILRNVNKADLMKIWGQIKSGNVEKRVFLDALLRAGTGCSVEASVEIVKQPNQLSPLEQQIVYLSLGNVKHVDSDAVKAASTLLDLPNIPKELYLGVGAVAGVYCRDHNCHNEKTDGITAVSSKLAAKINCRPKTKTEEDTVVAVLKGVRNIRHLEDNLIDKLIRCANDNSAKARVRVAALEAFGADPCAAKLKKDAIELMKNRQLDSEIRIKAYLAIIQCPCGGSANEIKTLLDSEPVHQVGRFISSSLRHIRASTNPDKKLARQHYGLISTPNRFNVDDRKYSFYRELSYNVDALGIGGSAEETVIYSQDSFLPRSVNLNLTAELFGHSLNLLEVGGRQGNLDRVVEHFLGPKSFLRTEKPQDVYDDLVHRFQEAGKKVEDSLKRGRRSVKTEVDNFDKHLKAESVPFNNELDLDIFVKLFGTDAIFLSLGDDKGLDANNLLDRLLKYVNSGIDEIKHFKHEIRTHLLFLDAELAYPTSTGLPLKLDLVGSATGRLDLASNVDVRQIIRNPKNAKIDVKVVPSTDVEISGLFLIDADAVSTGLKVVTNLHSSTGGHVIVKILEDGHGFDLQIGLPIDKQEIVTASNDLVYITAEKGQKEKQIPLKIDVDRKDYTACFDQLSGLLGLTVCGEISVPFQISADLKHSGPAPHLKRLSNVVMFQPENKREFYLAGPEAQASISKFVARYPLTGPSKLKLVLEKSDLKGYHVKGVLRTDNPEKQNFELLFEAEGSKNRRTSLTGDLIRTNDEKTLKLSLESPLKNVNGELSYITKPNERVALIKAKYDQSEYYAKAGFIVQGNDKKSVYKPIIEYELPDQQGKQSLKVDGQLTREVNGPATKYTLEGIKINLPSSNEVVDINGYINQEPKNYEMDIKAKKGEHNINLSGSLKEHDVKVEFLNTLNPFINFRVNGHIENGADAHHNDIEVFYGQDLKSTKNRIVFNQLLKYHKPTSDKDFDSINVITKNKFEISALPLKLQMDANVDRKKVDIEVEAVYLDKKGEFDLEARTNIKKPGDYSVKVTAELDKKGVEAFAKRDIVSSDKSNLENYIVLKGLGKYELSGVVLHKTKPNDVNVGAIGHLKVSGGGKGEDIKFDIGAVETTGMYSSHAKISSSNGEVLDYLLKITRGANANGQLKFVLKDAISANGQYKVTDADGKGHGMVIVDFKKTQRKIKADVNFLVKEPVYNADVVIFLNLDKDNNDKIHVSTNSKITGKLVDSKNKIEYAGKKAEVNIHRDGSIDGLGKSRSNVEVILPSERCLTLNMERDVDVKDDVINGNLHYTLSDATKKGGPTSSISLKSKATDTNYDNLKLNLEGQLEVKLKDGKNLDNKFYIKNTPEGEDKFKYDFKTEVTGSLIPKPASLSCSGSTKGGVTSWNEYDEKYRVKGNYGDDASFDLDGIFEIALPTKSDGKYHDDFTLAVRLPFEKAHDFKWVSNVLFILPQDKQVLAEYTVVQSVQVNADTYKVDASGKTGTKAGFAKMKVVIPHVDPLVLETSYRADTEEEKKKLDVVIKSQYGKGKTAAIDLVVQAAPREFGLDLVASAPQAEHVKKLELKMVNKIPTPDTFSSSLSVDVDGKVYSYDLTAVNSKEHPLIDLKCHCPNPPKDSRIYIKGSNINPGKGGKVEIKLENIRDVSLDAVSEAVISKDHVALKFSGNSDALKMKNYIVDISSKEAGSGKRLEFHASNDGKNLLSGSTSFISKQEGPKTIIEGSGSVKVKDDQKSANFKYIRTLLTEGTEQGVETFLNLAIGERSYVAEYRVTNLEYKSSYVYCEEKKQCANAEIHSKFSAPKAGTFQHVLNVGFDLRKLGFAPEFGLQVSNSVSEKQLPQYLLDLHVNKDDKKYYLHAYSQPEHGKFPAGITVTLPQRVLALESIMTYPTNQGMPFPVKGELALHLDKNKPNLKIASRFLVDIQGSKEAHSVLAELGFTHPKLGKEALLKFHSNMARKAENAIKIETATSFSHPTLGKDREAKLLLDVDPTHFNFFIHTPIVKVIDIEATAVLKENLQQGDIKFSLLEGKPVSLHGMVKDYQYYEFTSGYTDEQERKLSIIGRIEPEKRMDISADIILPKDKKNIIHGALYIQDSLVKSDYGLSKENFQYFVGALQKDLQTLEQRVKGLGSKASNELKDTMKRVQPTFQDLHKSSMEELDKLFKEVANDQALKEISEGLHQVVKFLAKLVDEVMQVSKPIVEKITQTISETCKKVMDMYEKQIEPQLKQVYANLSTAIREFLEGLLDIVAHFAAIAQDFFEKHKPELEELTNTIAEIFKDLTRLMVAQLKEFRGKAAEWMQNAMQQFKDLPIINIIKEKWQELAVPEQVLGVMHEAHNTLRNLLPTEETKAAADALYNYVQKKLRQEKVDDVVELRKVYEKLTVALTSLTQFVRNQMSHVGVPAFINVNSLPLFAGPGQASAPVLGGMASLSIVNQLLKGDLPDPLAIIRAYRPRSFNPLDEIPNRLRAVVVNGQHIFTFDGRHLTFPGTCRYVLAHDHVDRNFTLVLQLQNGAPKALILEDKSGNVVELKENGQVTLNGAAHGFPVDDKDTFAFRQPNGRVGLGSSYGIMALCTSKLQVCYITASGFYLGKLRGLLGDGNNEPYDDFRMPNGKITTSESEFGNSYKLASSCPAAKAPEHSSHQHHAALPPACEQVFGGASPLRPLGLLLDAAPFRQACIHAVTGDSANAVQQACDLARGYTALAVTGMLPAVLPSVCVQCTDADQPRNVGDTFEVKLPNKQADIVVAFETTKSNEKNYKELVVPLVAQLIESLKKEHITDVKVYLVGVTPRMPYPLLYDTDLKLKNAKVEFKDESRYGSLPRVETRIPQVDKAMNEVANIVDYVRIKLGLHNIVAGYASVMDLPLRPGALKHTINVVGEHCQPAFAPLNFVRALAYGAAFEQMAYTHTLVAVTPDMKVGGGKDAAQIVGFTDDAVLLLGDKKLSKDSEALRPTLQLADDACIDFVENTDGLVLSATNFLATPAQQKQFIQTAASSITRQMLHQTLVQECVCAYADPFRVRSVCVNKDRKAKEAARRRK